MAVTTNDILKVVLDYVYPGAGTALNIFYYVYSGADQSETAILDALEDWVTNAWHNHWEDIASDQALINNMDVQQIDNTGLVLRDIGSRNINLNGNLVSEVMPAAVSAYLQAYTNVPQVRGKKYVPGIAETIVTNGTFAAGGLTALALLLLEYIDSINISAGNNLFPGVISSKEGGFRSFASGGTFNSIPAYQRRRKEGVGS